MPMTENRVKQTVSLSVIIPTYNEAANITELIGLLKSSLGGEELEIIVVDSCASTDDTAAIAEGLGARVVCSDRAGRAPQLHQGACLAGGEALFFLHADTRPPEGFARLITDSLSRGHDFGMFSYRFDSDSRLLRINSSTTKRVGVFTGGGDQGMYIKREVYFAEQGFDTDLAIMEDFDLYWRLKSEYSFEIIPHDMLVSARKYERNSYLRVQLVNLAALLGFKMGVDDERLRKMYGRMLG